MTVIAMAGLWAMLLAACTPAPREVVVVGGGPAGLAAAVEAARGGAHVVLVEGNGMLGGSAIYGQAITAVPGEAGLASWNSSGGANPARERYATQVQVQVVDWLSGQGLRWHQTWNPHADGSTLYEPAGGGVGVVRVLSEAAKSAGVEIRLGERVSGLIRERRLLVQGKDRLEADAVILATGGFMGDLEAVRARRALDGIHLLRGAPRAADGNGLALGTALGGVEQLPARSILYAHGVPAPDDDSRAMMFVESFSAWPLSVEGRYLAFLQSPRGDSGGDLVEAGGRAWLVVDGPTLAEARLWDVDHLQNVALRPILLQVGGKEAETLEELAATLSLPGVALESGVSTTPPLSGRRRGHRTPEEVDPLHPLSQQGPYAAIPVYPTTAKSLTGLSVDLEGRVLDARGAAVPGLYAAGELTGFGDPYQGAPYDSTMVAGAVLTGRAAARAALSDP